MYIAIITRIKGVMANASVWGTSQTSCFPRREGAYIPGLVVQTSSVGLGLHIPALLHVIMTGITGKSPSSHCKDTVSPSVVDTTLTLGDNTG